MFNHCMTIPALDAAYEEACKAVKPSVSFDVIMAAAAANKEIPSDGRDEQFDAITAAMRARWSALSGKPWPRSAPSVAQDARHYEDSDRPDMEQ